MMNKQERYTGWKLYASLAFFALISLIAFWFFFAALIELIAGLASHNAIFTFDKGSFYLLGAGAGTAVLCFSGFYESVLKREFGKRLGKWIGAGLAISVLVALLLPNIAHYSIAQLADSRSYTLCESASDRWLYLRTLVYSKTPEACEAASKRQ